MDASAIVYSHVAGDIGTASCQAATPALEGSDSQYAIPSPNLTYHANSHVNRRAQGAPALPVHLLLTSALFCLTIPSRRSTGCSLQ
jgi:hypothetical protein